MNFVPQGHIKKASICRWILWNKSFHCHLLLVVWETRKWILRNWKSLITFTFLNSWKIGDSKTSGSLCKSLALHCFQVTESSLGRAFGFEKVTGKTIMAGKCPVLLTLSNVGYDFIEGESFSVFPKDSQTPWIQLPENLDDSMTQTLVPFCHILHSGFATFPQKSKILSLQMDGDVVSKIANLLTASKIMTKVLSRQRR